ncbi:hypothetical protein H8N00_16300 [Streptomyces sp. AC563]|uniref:hypothetical protein n=1 Tax=Streptomyces buecherae TaxID=2763006 RepID=UPI00164DD5C3|nr:hypothetical protein [Streptomyces buecherae]MBC3990409.1 hypothetical protein [Streptomyces buecherae]
MSPHPSAAGSLVPGPEVDVLRWVCADVGQPLPEGVLSENLYEALNAVMDYEPTEESTWPSIRVLRSAALQVAAVARLRGKCGGGVRLLHDLFNQVPGAAVPYARLLSLAILDQVDLLLNDAGGEPVPGSANRPCAATPDLTGRLW